jgi:hypothetical protein
MEFSWGRALLAGIVGTIIFDLVGLAITGSWWNIPAVLGVKLGTGYIGGVIGHHLIGMLMAAIYAAIAPSLWGPSWAPAVLIVTIETIIRVWCFMRPPLVAGIAGRGLSPGVPLISLARHWGDADGLITLSPLRDQISTTSIVGRRARTELSHLN